MNCVPSRQVCRLKNLRDHNAHTMQIRPCLHTFTPAFRVVAGESIRLRSSRLQHREIWVVTLYMARDRFSRLHRRRDVVWHDAVRDVVADHIGCLLRDLHSKASQGFRQPSAVGGVVVGPRQNSSRKTVFGATRLSCSSLDPNCWERPR